MVHALAIGPPGGLQGPQGVASGPALCYHLPMHDAPPRRLPPRLLPLCARSPLWRLVAGTLFSAALFGGAQGCAAHLPPQPVGADDWIRHQLCDEVRGPQGEALPRCLEVIELGAKPTYRRATALLIPGMFHNGAVFDLMPERGISFARFLVSQGVEVYLLHVRGIGGSELPPGTGIDGLVIEDLPAAIDFVAAQAGEPILALGHSQGAMTLQAALSGLRWCEGGVPCFDGEVARARQAQVRAVGLFTGNVALTTPSRRLHALAGVAQAIEGPLERAGKVPGRRLFLTGYDLFGEGGFDILFTPGRHPPEVTRALLARSVEHTLGSIGARFAQGIAEGGVQSGGQRWADHLDKLLVPTLQVTFGGDLLAPPETTWRDDFRHIGAEKKRFKRVAGQSHEDFLLSPEGHAQHWMTVQELIDGF